MRPGPLSLVLSAFGLLALACCLPTSEEATANRQAADAKEAQVMAEASAKLDAHRARVAAIAAQLPTLPPVTDTPCDAAAVSALRASPPAGVDPVSWRVPFIAESGWLQAAVAANAEQPDPAIGKLAVSQGVRLAFRAASTPTASVGDLTRWAERIAESPPILAVLHVDAYTAPVLVYKGAAFVDGQFTAGRADVGVTLWDLAAGRLLCSGRATATSSASLNVGGGIIPQEAENVVADDFAKQLRVALNGAADGLSPGLLLVP